jgi:hypothetical protein
MPPHKKKHDLVDVVLPDLGVDAKESRLVAWVKEEGDLVHKRLSEKPIDAVT